ncbi:EMB2076 [Symbiodinium natans]|uniref:EMB2076 protein n=1 Tax=Symbiodinium natans TaxID=878477 RepID=A0A812RSE3_9DINO|nr:EMB2076 [Symbiodinium natans]
MTCALGQWESAARILATMLQDGPSPNVVSFSACIGSDELDGEGAWGLGLSLMNSMPCQRVRPNHVTLSSILGRIGGRWQLALGIFKALQGGLRLDTAGLNAVIGAAAAVPRRRMAEGLGDCEEIQSFGQWLAAIALLSGMASIALRADVVSFTSAVAACERKWQTAVALLEPMYMAKSLGPNSITYRCLLRACENGHSWQPALELLSYMAVQRMSDRISQQRTAAACAKSGQLGKLTPLMRSTCCLEGNSEARERKDLAGRITVQVVAAAAQAFGGLVQCVSFEGTLPVEKAIAPHGACALLLRKRCFRDTQTGGSTAMCSDVLSSEKKWSTRVGAMSQHMGDAVERPAELLIRELCSCRIKLRDCEGCYGRSLACIRMARSKLTTPQCEVVERRMAFELGPIAHGFLQSMEATAHSAESGRGLGEATHLLLLARIMLDNASCWGMVGERHALALDTAEAQQNVAEVISGDRYCLIWAASPSQSALAPHEALDIDASRSDVDTNSIIEKLAGGLKLLSMVRSQSWLEEWLWKLRVQIPTFSDVAGGFNFTISDGLCTNFKVDHILTAAVYHGLNITASGLSIHCTLKWDAQSTLISSLHFNGDVLATVGNGMLGGPITMVSDSLDPPLPSAIHAQDCSGRVQVDLEFTGSGMSTVLQFLKPLIQSALNKRLTALICTNVDSVINSKGSEALQNVSQEIREMLKDWHQSSKNSYPVLGPGYSWVLECAHDLMAAFVDSFKHGRHEGDEKAYRNMHQACRHVGVCCPTILIALSFLDCVMSKVIADPKKELVDFGQNSGLDAWQIFRTVDLAELGVWLLGAWACIVARELEGLMFCHATPRACLLYQYLLLPAGEGRG